MRRLPIAVRLAAKVDKSGGPNSCWPWTGSRNNIESGGHGRIGSGIGKKIVLAHRVAWELENGPIPPGICVCHRCDNSPCCNPSHLFLGTQAENILDMHRKGRSVYVSGVSCHLAKLSEHQVQVIRFLRHSTSLSGPAIGALFGVVSSAVYGIANGNNWAHVPPLDIGPTEAQ